MKSSLTAATRGGVLAAVQTEIVCERLKKICPEIEIQIKKIASAGDKDRRTSLWDLKTSGFFTTQIEDAVLAGQADFAVHSFKDLPTAEREGLIIAAVLDRKYPEDCIVASGNVKSIEKLKKGALVGTSSLRRAVQIKRLRRDLQVAALRGNVPTRIKKVLDGAIDAAVLARAGLERLGEADKISFCLDPKEFIPAPAQGALAVQTRRAEETVTEMVSAIDERISRLVSLAERQILVTTKCGCHAPVGAFTEVEGESIEITAFISDAEGRRFIKEKIKGPLEEAIALAEKLANILLDSGGREILAEMEKC
jgi:hydroxymethylbilane synthase